MRFIKILLLVWFAFFCVEAYSQKTWDGIVKDAQTGEALRGATVQLILSGYTTSSDEDGRFTVMSSLEHDTIRVNFQGYIPFRLSIPTSQSFIEVGMRRAEQQMEIVEIQTGYYSLPRERATGSFVHINNVDLNRISSSNVLERLDGVVPGVQFVTPGGRTGGDIRVRGLATIESEDAPLIILDNFPYNGDINHINPDDIESVTILKDAAAASIWGARAGNGVIVLTTKKGRQDNIARLTFRVNSGLKEKPDLFYSQKWLPSSSVMAFEKERYHLGHYNMAANQVNPYYVELLHAHAQGQIDDTTFAAEESLLVNVDSRQHVSEKLFRHARTANYTLNVNGGSAQYSYNLSLAHYSEAGEQIGNNWRRLNLNLRNVFRPLSYLELSAGIMYAQQENQSNGISLATLSPASYGLSPYLRLYDKEGNSLAVPRQISYGYAGSAEENGLLDWYYRPLDELSMADNRTSLDEMRLSSGVTLRILKGLKIALQHDYSLGGNSYRNFYEKESYFVRDLVNSFTQPNGARVIPHNGILDSGPRRVQGTHNGRLQVDYNRTWNTGHDFILLGGVEVHQSLSYGFAGARLYNYDDQYKTGSTLYNFTQSYPKRPVGNGRIPPSVLGANYLHTNRDLSYFANGSYSYRNSFTLSSSVRWDASNLFGVKTNEKGVPLWSIGGSWDITRGSHFKLNHLLSDLRLRTTYGISGNVNKSLTHFPVIRNTASTIPDLLDYATVTSFGNPTLRWERVKTVNLGLEWQLSNRRLKGEIEHYWKNGNDLIGNDYLDPTTGIIDQLTMVPGVYKINYANIKTVGWDISLTSRNLVGALQWTTTLFSSWVHNKVTNFNTNESILLTRYFTDPPPIRGQSRDAVYSIPWKGLSSDNGLPLLFIDGVESLQYASYMSQMTLDDLERSGVAVPTFYGAFRNGISWKGVELGVLLTWKGGHVFRKDSYATFDEYKGLYHQDYFLRWQQVGDEIRTHVPASFPISEEDQELRALSSYYKNSSVLIEKGDHIRLQEITLNYALPASVLNRLPVQNFTFTANMRHMGVIWKESKKVIDPDFPDTGYPLQRSISLGISCVF